MFSGIQSSIQEVMHSPSHSHPPASQSSPVIIRLRKRRSGQTHPAVIILTLASAGFVLLALLAVMAILSAFGYYQLTDRIYPGVQTAGLELSGMTPSEAARHLEKSWNLEKYLLVTNGSENQSISPIEIGLLLNGDLTAQTAFKVGHSGSLFNRATQAYDSLKDGWQVKPSVSLDPAIARQGLEALAHSMSQPARDATLRVEGARLVAVPAELGYTINIEETLKVLENNLLGVLERGIFEVVPQPVLPVIPSAEPYLAESQALLDRPAAINLYDPITDETLSISIPPETLASWIRVSTGEQGIQISLDEQAIAIFLSGLESQLGQDRTIDASRQSKPLAQALQNGLPYWVTPSHRSNAYTVQPGDTMLKIGWSVGMPFWMILQANPGLDPDTLIAGSQLTIPSKDSLLPLPVIANKRIVINLSKQRLWVYQDGNLLKQHVISTGIDKSPTQPGVFQVQSHEPNAYASVWDLYMPNFLGIYEAWPGFMNGIHGLPTLSNGRRLWANVLGQPASYGCIILGLNEAEWLYNWAEDGVVVDIQP